MDCRLVTKSGRYTGEHIICESRKYKCLKQDGKVLQQDATHTNKHFHSRSKVLTIQTHLRNSIYSGSTRPLALPRTHVYAESTCAHSLAFASVGRVPYAPSQHITTFLQWCVRVYMHIFDRPNASHISKP